jgi:hypothetical protein
MSRLNRYRKVHFLGFELFLSILLSFVFGVWVILFGGSVIVESILHGNRSAVYGTLAAICGSLLGFVITALAINIGYSSNEKFEFLRKSKHYPTMWRVMLSTVKALSIATVVMIIGLVLDCDSSPNNLVLCCCVFAILFALFRLKRCIWVLDNVIHIIIIDNTEQKP